MHFDLQAHRGGLALTVENTLAAFERALAVGVSTLEFDVQVTADGRAVIAHDADHGGHRIRDLTLAEARSLDVGSVRDPRHPEQALAPGARMPLLSEVADLLRAVAADTVRCNVELKVAVTRPGTSADAAEFVDVVLAELDAAGILGCSTIQSFDWAALRRVSDVAPEVATYVLSHEDRLEVGRRGASPWLGGLDIDDFAGSVQHKYVAAAASIGAAAVSPVHGTYADGPGGRSHVPFTTAELVEAAHEQGLLVVPYTVNDAALMAWLIGLGVDGFITDHPDRARDVMDAHGLELPPAYVRSPPA
ncbi:hypothetical protein KUV85_16270 [Nocardioides panacisoli]|uniref:glycerophosphodiester phosphodiesterase family protein n=1 Tax=Nocardioides panacisoli TaxID=627624 RepID=UPI001C63A9F1|nr:glycerophosphodiester phosphodiesterase family protein [Nocardioides panacisoli]QYJ03856.1 hypothetical protein KUV85_16270 [Nocardioides panacisoli]